MGSRTSRSRGVTRPQQDSNMPASEGRGSVAWPEKASGSESRTDAELLL